MPELAHLHLLYIQRTTTSHAAIVQGEKKQKKNMQPMQMSVILVYGPVTQGQQESALTDTSPKSNRGRWATGCLVEVNPSSPVAPAFGSREKIPDVALVLVLERI